VKVNDGLVLAADSATTLIDQTTSSVVNVYNNANKIFNLRKGLPIAAITWGAGSIGPASISTLAKDLRKRLAGEDPAHPDWTLNEQSYTIEEAATRLREFLYEELYVPTFAALSQKPYLGLIVAGYSAGAALAEAYQVTMDDNGCNAPALLIPQDANGTVWNGMTEAVQRLVFGFGTGMPEALKQNLGVPEAQITPILDILRAALNVTLTSPAMPIQDAIEYAEFLVDVSIKWSRFSPGSPIVGGPVESAAISKHEGFKWIRRKHYYDSALNPEG